MEKRNSQLEHGTANGANKPPALHVWLRCGWQSTTTPVSLLSIELDVQTILQGQVSLAAVNQICVVYEAMNCCKNLKIHYRIASKM